jgi:CRISPR system Cascade subunit CasB
MSDKFNQENAVGKRLLEWWQRLEDDRASRAVLRRAESITAVALSAPYQRLYRILRNVGWNAEDKPYLNDRLAAAVGLLAHVKQNSDVKPAKSMSQREPGADRPAVSELRFVRLLESPDIDALFSGVRRVLPLMDGRINVLALANDILFWGDRVKKDWAYTYEWPAKSAA